MVARDAREDAKTSLELTVTEFAVSVRAINPAQSKVSPLITAWHSIRSFRPLTSNLPVTMESAVDRPRGDGVQP
jgi:hypothetical protein